MARMLSYSGILLLVLLAVTATISFADEDLSGDTDVQGSCEVCTYVVQNKQNKQPYLCRGLTDPGYQKACVKVLQSMMWWVANEVYWTNYGCQKGGTDWIRPCPPHAICSWLQDLSTQTSFCPADPDFPKPT